MVTAGVASGPNNLTPTSGPLGVNSAVSLANVAGTSLNLNNFNVSIGSITGGGTTGGSMNLGGGTLTVGGDGTSPAAYSGVISGTGGLVKIGSGKLILNAASNFTGNIVINGGIVSDTFVNNVTNVATSALGNPQTVGRTVTINNGATLSFDAAAGNDLGNSGSTTVALGFIINQGSTLQLTADTTPVGPITLNGGTMTATATSGGSTLWFGLYYLNGNVIVGGTSPSTISSTSTSTTGYDINLVGGGAGTRTFTVGVTGSTSPDLTVSAPLGNASSATGLVANLIKAGLGTMSLNSANIYTGTTTVSNGTLTIAPTGSLTSPIITVAAGATLNANGLAASNGKTNSGLIATTALTSNGATIFAGNMGSGSPALVTLASLTLGSTGTVLVTDPGLSNHNNRTVLVTSSLTFATINSPWGGKVDLAGNDMIVHAGNLPNLTSQIQQGFNNGAWNGSGGITSSAAAGDTTRLTALAVIQNDNGASTGTPLFPSTFDGQPVVDSDMLVKYTDYGDTTLDGIVDGSDYSRIDAAYLADATALTGGGSTLPYAGPATGWFNGDFNYDGYVNGSDYTLIDNAFNAQSAVPLAQLDPGATATAQISSVPEPATLGLLAMGVVGLLGRRRRATPIPHD